jgi:hypothetical protein
MVNPPEIKSRKVKDLVNEAWKGNGYDLPERS